ncbi:MAG TPA: acetyl-CoA hydrolase/transferase C-terminal domain-containing protein [Myxococcota bacterium]|nr:acetyl-CoA hydrolase/transferase C-terminal domain-containing protein [Myxococcota bacterium]HRY96772.1 acetyl-CoA hydrolase/transferase C-terminal domain-containing protein [Myxococcota bacterium]HSA23465.1 acetyl-CoA hydrolase/transferase C-terminal domain-containing protein [Myxococcota bacterium]
MLAGQAGGQEGKRMGPGELPEFLAGCLVSHEEALTRLVRSGRRIASGFATSEPHTFYDGLWEHIQRRDLRELQFKQALFMAPHRLCIGHALEGRGLLGQAARREGALGRLAGRVHRVSRKLQGLGRLAEHYRELRARRITFTSPFIGATLNPIIPDHPLLRVVYPELAGRNSTRMGITDMQSIHFPDAVDSMGYDPDLTPLADLFVLVMTPPDERGELSHGLANGANGEILELILEHRSVDLLLYLNPAYPFTRGYGDAPNSVPAERFRPLAEAGRLTVVWDADGKLPCAPSGSFANPSRSEVAIAEHVVNHIEAHAAFTHGRAIQVGIGRTGVQAIRLLRDSSWTGRMYTEMLEPFSLDLLEAGKIAGSHLLELDGRRTPLDGKVVCTFTMAEEGSGFYRRLDRNPAVVIAPASRVVISPAFYGGLGINNCLGVDFQGHVNAAGKDRNHHSGIGGQGQIVRGLSVGGVAYLCLKSTHRTPTGELRSSICPYQPVGTPISLVGADLMGGRQGGRVFLVTEHGVARLSGQSQSGFIRALVSVAHPRFQPWLRRRAWEEFRVTW